MGMFYDFTIRPCDTKEELFKEFEEKARYVPRYDIYAAHVEGRGSYIQANDPAALFKKIEEYYKERRIVLG